MKRIYETPTMMVVRIQHAQIICQSLVTSIGGNAEFDFGGASSNDISGQGARVPEFDGILDEGW